jgi:hypothetical protein
MSDRTEPPQLLCVRFGVLQISRFVHPREIKLRASCIAEGVADMDAIASLIKSEHFDSADTMTKRIPFPFLIATNMLSETQRQVLLAIGAAAQ